jgi:hypothetical protein
MIEGRASRLTRVGAKVLKLMSVRGSDARRCDAADGVSLADACEHAERMA